MSVAFRKIQIGDEAVRGTPVAATTLAIGDITLTPTSVKHSPTDSDGVLAMRRRIVEIGRRCQMQYEADATFEQITWLLSAALRGVTAGAGAGTPKTWTYTPLQTQHNAQRAWTIEYGDDQQAWRSSFCMVTSLELSWETDGVLSVTAEIFGRFPQKNAFTASLAHPVVNEIIANYLRIYIDDSWANLGTTQKNGLITSGRIRINTGLNPAKYANGTLDYDGFTESKRSMEIELNMTNEATQITEYDAYVANSLRAIRLDFVGPIITGADRYMLRFDMLGHYTQDPQLFSDRDGDNIVVHKLESATDGTNEMSVVAVNRAATLP